MLHTYTHAYIHTHTQTHTHTHTHTHTQSHTHTLTYILHALLMSTIIIIDTISWKATKMKRYLNKFIFAKFPYIGKLQSSG